MNLFQLVLKQMRQRALSTWLTMLSVVLGVSLADAIMILRREGQNLFAQTDFGFDVIIGPPKGSPLQLTLNTIYHMEASQGVIPYQLYDDISRKAPPPAGRPDYRPYVRIAVPFMVGDSFKNRRIVGTSPRIFGYEEDGNPVSGEKFMYRADQSYEIVAPGRVFAARKFEAVIGSEVAESLHLHLYDDKLSEAENEARGGAFRATHGMPTGNQPVDIHKPRWRIVGILKPTHTANDHVLFVPVVSLYAIAEHEAGMIDQALLKANIDPRSIGPDRIDEVLQKLGIDSQSVPESVKRKFKLQTTSGPATASVARDTGELMKDAAPSPATQQDQAQEEEPDAYHLDERGDIVPDLPQDEWALSAILVQTRGYPAGGFQARWLMYNFQVIDDRATAINPASVMRDFFDTFLKGSTTILLLISGFVTVVAGASIMTTIYNSVSARLREIAILRALGATRVRILTIICTEAIVIGLVGGAVGLVCGHALAAAGSIYLREHLGEGINWLAVAGEEWLYLGGVVVLSAVAGLVPALKAYKTPVATNLVSG